ncbi:MAG: hypothetical protein ACRD1C_02270 [Terriglobales bacterium]
MRDPVEPDHNPLKRSYSVPAEVAVALPTAAVRARVPPPRDLWLRVAIFAMLLGAVMTLLYAWFLARPVGVVPTPEPGLASFLHVLVPILAAMAVVGVLLLERAPVLGVVFMLAGTLPGLAGGAIWLIPGAALGCILAARRHAAARATLGFLLLLPGIAASYYGFIGGIGFALGEPVHGLPPVMAQPLTLGQALLPLEFLPLALLGAWLLVRPLHSRPM